MLDEHPRISSREVCELARYSRSTLWKRIDAGHMPAPIDRGQPIPPEVVEAITSNVDVRVRAVPSPYRDLRIGIIWLGVGIGVAALGLALNFTAPDATYPLLGVAAFPGFIGLAFILISFLGRDRKS